MRSNLFHAVFLLDNLAMIKFKNRIRSQAKWPLLHFLWKFFFFFKCMFLLKFILSVKRKCVKGPIRRKKRTSKCDIRLFLKMKEQHIWTNYQNNHIIFNILRHLSLGNWQSWTEEKGRLLKRRLGEARRVYSFSFVISISTLATQ